MVVRTLWIGPREGARVAAPLLGEALKSPIVNGMRNCYNKLRTTMNIFVQLIGRDGGVVGTFGPATKAP